MVVPREARLGEGPNAAVERPELVPVIDEPLQVLPLVEPLQVLPLVGAGEPVAGTRRAGRVVGPVVDDEPVVPLPIALRPLTHMPVVAQLRVGPPGGDGQRSRRGVRVEVGRGGEGPKSAAMRASIDDVALFAGPACDVFLVSTVCARRGEGDKRLRAALPPERYSKP